MGLRSIPLVWTGFVLLSAACNRAPAPPEGLIRHSANGLDYMARQCNAGDYQAIYALADAPFRARVNPEIWDDQWQRIRRGSGDWVSSVSLIETCSGDRAADTRECEFQGIVLFDHGEYRMDASWMVQSDLPILTQLHLQSNDPRIWIAAPLLVPVKTDPVTWYYPPHRPASPTLIPQPWRQTPIDSPAPKFLRDGRPEPADRS